MRQRPHHPARNFFGQFRPLNSQDSTDSAHSALLYREAARSSTLTCKMLRTLLQICRPQPLLCCCSASHESILEAVAAAEERLLEIFPGQFCNRIRHESRKKRDPRLPSVTTGSACSRSSWQSKNTAVWMM